MAREDRERWNEKHRHHADPHEAANALAEWIEWLAPGTALDLACGTGGAAALLTRKGWRVLGVDISLVALSRARQRASPAAFVLADLDRFHLAPASVDTAVCIHFLDRALIRRVEVWLRPAGTLYLETFTTAHRKYRPGFRREYLLEPGEAPRLVRVCDVIHHEERDDGARAVAILIARRR